MRFPRSFTAGFVHRGSRFADFSGCDKSGKTFGCLLYVEEDTSGMIWSNGVPLLRFSRGSAVVVAVWLLAVLLVVLLALLPLLLALNGFGMKSVVT